MKLLNYKEKEIMNEIEYRPWGKFETLYDTSGYKVKVITVNPGQRLSLQRHRWRDEFWTIVEGAGRVEIETEYENLNFYVYVKDFLDIYKGQWHRITNTEQTPLVFIEVQVGDCFEEDIDRKEDDYGRISEKEVKQGYNESDEQRRARNKPFYDTYG
jgi:mannose-6-phosphate isomerase-like protein (cupin superfamily)